MRFVGVSPLRSGLFIGTWTGRTSAFLPEALAIWWPDDRSWCVGSSTDIDSTAVGGPARLIEDVLADRRLEAFPVESEDSLMDDGDRVN